MRRHHVSLTSLRRHVHAGFILYVLVIRPNYHTYDNEVLLSSIEAAVV